ncbi:MAG: methyltransferase domain-containing protein [Candidatus Micrarchaeota archaeon]
MIDFKKLKRGPAVVLQKDSGLIVALTGFGSGSKAIDCGGGSGFLTLFLANIAGEKGRVYSYEKRPEFAKIILKNIEKTGFTNVEVKEQDALNGFDEKEIDLVTLDCAESEKLLPAALESLNEGGFAVGYLPHFEQAKKFVLTGEALGFTHYRTIEVIVRDFLVREKGMRPENLGLVHTAFLSFLQKPKK